MFFPSLKAFLGLNGGFTPHNLHTQEYFLRMLELNFD
jgi:hypothetical protein